MYFGLEIAELILVIVLTGLIIGLLLGLTNKFILHKIFSRITTKWLDRLKDKCDFPKIAKSYRRLSKYSTNKCKRDNLLGIAALYDHNSKEAIRLFQAAIDGGVGLSIRTFKGNLATAYLQGNRYQEAAILLEELRGKGGLPIIAYVLVLLLFDEIDTAKAFCQSNPSHSEDSSSINILLQFSVDEPETLEAVKDLLKGQKLWLYQPLLKDLIIKWETDILFHTKNRYEVLEQEGKNLLVELENHPTFFHSPEVKYMRSVLVLLLPRIDSYKGCSELWGLACNYDALAEGLPIEEKLKERLSLYWKKIYRVYLGTRSPEEYDKSSEKNFIESQVPPNATEIVKGNSRCSLYCSDDFPYALRVMPANNQKIDFCYADFIEKSEADNIVADISPLIDLISEDSSTSRALEPLLYSLILDRNAVTKEFLIEILNQIPVSRHSKLDSLYQRVISSNR